ncbi:sugar phosphate nucleotidyltransferase [Fodinibius sp. SL11]|uniref:sugar phosphate nucleotidyltransferase n=1 Tax=Fodinibius sp. SL11 TaxID=3425690 RepID=UPI003F8821D4
MKVVLFCGGLGMRMRDYSEEVPKPMIKVGYRPVLWNIMKYYAHFGHKDFILCLGHKGDFIKRYFVEYEEYTSNNFVLNNGKREIELLNSDLDDWNITFVDTGMTSNVGQRLMKVRPYLEGEEMFLANYADGLSDMPLNEMIDQFKKSGKTGGFLAYQPTQSFHVAELGDNGMVNSINPISKSGLFINAGFFVLRNEIFDYINYGEELVMEPFQRLIKEKKLYGHRYEGFWMPLDTFKDKQQIDDMYAEGITPWQVWDQNGQEIATTKVQNGAKAL